MKVTVLAPRATPVRLVEIGSGELVVTGSRGARDRDGRTRLDLGQATSPASSGWRRRAATSGLTRFELRRDGLLRCRTLTGDITVGLATPPADARVLLLTMGGTVTSDLPVADRAGFGGQAEGGPHRQRAAPAVPGRRPRESHGHGRARPLTTPAPQLPGYRVVRPLTAAPLDSRGGCRYASTRENGIRFRHAEGPVALRGSLPAPVAHDQTSLDKALDICEALAAAERGLALSDLARAMRMPASTAHRLLAVLKRRGYVRQDEDSGRYGLTLKMLDLSFRWLGRSELRLHAYPIVREFVLRTGARAFIAVPQTGEVTYVWTAGPDEVAMHTAYGREMPGHCAVYVSEPRRARGA